MSELHQNESSNIFNYETIHRENFKLKEILQYKIKTIINDQNIYDCNYRDKMKLLFKELILKHKITSSLNEQISHLRISKDNGYDYYCYYKKRLSSHPMVEKHFFRHKGVFKSKEDAEFAIKRL